MNVVVLGGTGFVGARLVRELTERGHAVTAVSRHPETADDDLPAGVRTAAGDVTDRESLESAFTDVDPAAVVNLVALSPLFVPRGGNARHETVHLGGTKTAVDVALDHDVDRFVQFSALGADPEGATAYIRAKGAAEDVVREVDLESTVVRPSVVFGDGGEFVDFTRTLTTPYVTGLPGGGKTRFQPIWVGDLVAMLPDCLEGDRFAGRTLELGGPEQLTLADVTDLVYRADGRWVVVCPIPMPIAKIGLAIGGAIPRFPMGLDQYRSLRFDNTVADNDVRLFGEDPAELRTLAEYLGVDESGTEA